MTKEPRTEEGTGRASETPVSPSDEFDAVADEPRNGWGSREHIEDVVARALCEIEETTGFLGTDDQAEQVTQALIGDRIVFERDEWDNECHRCEARIGDHTIDGRCPDQVSTNGGSQEGPEEG